jgi:hypothetical protein
VDNPYTTLDGIYLNAVTLDYTRRYEAAQDALQFTAAGQQPVAVRGFSSAAVTVYDVTDPAAPVRLAAGARFEGDGYTLRLTPPTTGLRRLVAVGPSGYVTPARIEPTSPVSYRSGAAAYVIVAHDSLLAAADRQAAYHTQEGLPAVVVPVSAIYDQFGTGQPDPAAIAAFLAYTQHAWQPAPRYGLLLGSATVDPHNYLGQHAGDLVPTAYVATSFSGRTASDAHLRPVGSELALGRLPARTAAEADAVVTKLITYAGSAHHWPATVTLLADSADAGRFDRASDALTATLGATRIEPLYESQLGTATAGRLLDAFNQGRALINFYGHGSASQWGTGNLFDTARVPLLANPGREPFVTVMTCHNGDYDALSGASTLTALVLQPGGGAIGGLGATAASLDTGHHQLAETFYTHVLRGERVGDALRAAYDSTTDPDVRAQFHLIGDPALRVDLGR